MRFSTEFIHTYTKLYTHTTSKLTTYYCCHHHPHHYYHLYHVFKANRAVARILFQPRQRG